MKVCVAGYGSIGKRHVSNMTRLFQENRGELQIDLLRSGRGEGERYAASENIHRMYYSSEELPSDYDVIFITNPTSLHYSSFCALQEKGRHFFIEKPVFSETEPDLDCLKPLKSPDRICYVACPLRYTQVIRYLKEQIDFSDVYCVRAICSSYLPEWRKGTDYRKTYSASKSLGGGVDIDLIHEWDYLCYLLGFPDKVRRMSGKYSSLEIESDDLAVYIASYPDKLVELHLDYFGRENKRQVELFLKEETITADIGRSVIRRKDAVIEFGQERNDFYMEELKHFFHLIITQEHCDNDVRNALAVLKLAKGELG